MEQWVVGNLILDPATKRARRGERHIDLTAKEYSLLETLVRHRNQVLTRDQIIEHVWDNNYDAESKLIEVYIYALRQKIDGGELDKLIHTVRGLGYSISANATE